MKDTAGREINYLRLSVTDKCNLRCLYCMPEEGVLKKSHSEILSIEEIEEIVLAAADCGITKIRVTGGEPLVRRGIIDICSRIARIPSIKELCLTTNGTLLPRYARQLKETGVDRLNISIDTLNEEKYKKITRLGTLKDTLDGIEAAQIEGFTNIKLNVVLVGGFNDDEIPDFVALTKSNDFTVRFIELMPIGQCATWNAERFLSAEKVLEAVPELAYYGTDGVSRLYRLPDAKGSVGLISPISLHFCPYCSRIRVTADGKLKPCLHSSEELSLRELHGRELQEAISGAIMQKPFMHHLNGLSASESLRNMNAIGG